MLKTLGLSGLLLFIQVSYMTCTESESMTGNNQLNYLQAQDSSNNTSETVESDVSLVYSSEDFTIVISPPSSYGIDIGSEANISINITLPTQSNITLRARSSSPEIVDIAGVSEFHFPEHNDGEPMENPSLHFVSDASSAIEGPIENHTRIHSVNLRLRGVFVGYASIELYLTQNNSQEKLPIAVKSSAVRVQDAVYIGFQVFIWVGFALLYIATGCEMDFQIMKDTLRKPKAPAVALISQFTIMPLLAYGISRMMGYTGGSALGLFLMGCGPGGGVSNVYTHLLDGDLSVSITMTTLSTIVSFAMIPFWAYTLGQTLPADPNQEGPLVIPFLDLLRSLAALLVPLLIGALIKWKLPKVAKVLTKLLKVAMILFAITLITFGVYANLYIFVSFDPKLIFSGALLPYGGFILGGLVAWALRFDWRMIKTIAIETGIQNVGVVVLILLAALPQPAADLSLVPMAAAAIMTPLPLFVWAVVHNVVKKCQRSDQETDSEDGSRQSGDDGDPKMSDLELIGNGAPTQDSSLLLEDERAGVELQR